MAIVVEPVTADRLADLEELFGPRGAWSGCWCMWNRQTNAEYERDKYEPNRQALRAVISEGREQGVLAYENGVPVGWAALAPRSEYSRLARSPITKPVDDAEVWSVTCFVVARGHRRQGVATALLAGAISRARQLGAAVLEGYPVAPDGDMDDASAYHGVESMFRSAGFIEVARRKPKRPIYRLALT